MDWRQGTLSRRSGRIHNLTEIRQAAGMHVWILMRVFVRIRMLDHPARGLRFLNDPCTIAFLQMIGHRHAPSRRTSGLWPKFTFGLRLLATDDNVSHVRLQAT